MLDDLALQLDDLTMAVAAYVDATAPLLVSSGPWGEYGALSADDLYYYQERVANLDRWVADGRVLAEHVADLDRRIAEAVGAASAALSSGGDAWPFASARELQAAAADLARTISDYLEDLRLVYGAAVSDADRVAAALAERSRRRAAALVNLAVVR